MFGVGKHRKVDRMKGKGGGGLEMYGGEQRVNYRFRRIDKNYEMEEE